VTLPPGRARLSTRSAETGSVRFTNTIGTARVIWCSGPTTELPLARMTSGASAIISVANLRMRRYRWRPTRVDAQVAANRPAQLSELLKKRCIAGLQFVIIRRESHEHADAPHPLALLRVRCKRPSRCGATEQGDELASFHSTGFHLIPKSQNSAQHIALGRIKSGACCAARVRPRLPPQWVIFDRVGLD
jgi:hypothetical protein